MQVGSAQMRLSIAVLCCLAGQAWGQLESFGLSPTEIAAVNKGELVITKFPPPNNSGVSFQAVQRMRVKPSALRPILRDCQHFHEFMPHTLKSVMTDRKGNTAVCEMVVDMPFPFSDLWSIVNSEWGEISPGVWRRSWSLVKGSFKRNMGSWTVVSTSNPNVSYTIYKASVDPEMAVPDFILRKAQVNSIPNLMTAILKRARMKLDIAQ